jgi:hypothetical protein
MAVFRYCSAARLVRAASIQSHLTLRRGIRLDEVGIEKDVGANKCVAELYEQSGRVHAWVTACVCALEQLYIIKANLSGRRI